MTEENCCDCSCTRQRAAATTVEARNVYTEITAGGRRVGCERAATTTVGIHVTCGEGTVDKARARRRCGEFAAEQRR